jgi:hypothetical protein
MTETKTVTGRGQAWVNQGEGTVTTTLTGPRGGSAGYAELSPADARELAESLLNSADDAESGQPSLHYNVEVRTPEGQTLYFGVKATNKLDAHARGIALHNRRTPEATLVAVTESEW